jgi:hypothetical protein
MLKKLFENGDPATLATAAAAASVGKRVAQLALLIKAGADACRGFLSHDQAYEALVSALQPANPDSQTQPGG